MMSATREEEGVCVSVCPATLSAGVCRACARRVCARACVCARARVRACVCVCVMRDECEDVMQDESTSDDG